MALRWVEGFEVRQADAYFVRLYGNRTGSWGHSGGRKHGFSAGFFNDSLTTPALVGSPTNTWFVQFDMRKQTLSTNGGIILELQDSGGEQCNLNIINSPSFAGHFRIEFRRGTTVLETSPDIPGGSPTVQAWFSYVLKVVVNTGTGGSFELRQYDRLGNSTVLLNTASVNTANQGTAGADRVKLQAPALNLDFDNWLVWDDVNVPVGTVFTDFHTGPFLVYGSLPDGDGNQTDWEPSSGGANFALVDDPANAPNDNDEVTAQVVGDIDLYTMQDVGSALASSPTIRAVVADVRYVMKNSGTRNLQVRVRDVTMAEADEGNAIVANSTTVDEEIRVMEENPVTSAAWTATEVDGVEMGVKLES